MILTVKSQGRSFPLRVNLSHSFLHPLLLALAISETQVLDNSDLLLYCPPENTGSHVRENVPKMNVYDRTGICEYIGLRNTYTSSKDSINIVSNCVKVEMAQVS